MADAPKTLPTDADPRAFVAAATPARRRRDGERLLELMAQITGEPPVMWGPSIVGFGSVEYAYASGRTGVWPPVAFSPRRAALTVYLMEGVGRRADDLAALGPHTASKGCLYLKDLEAVDVDVLARMIREAWAAAGPADQPR